MYRESLLLTMGLLNNKTALITGATDVFGKAIALRFAEEGANIAFVDTIVYEDIHDLEQEIEAKGVKAKGYECNVADYSETLNLFQEIKEEFATIDILVHNAAIAKDGLLLRMDETLWDAVIDNNLKSAYNFTHHCIPTMIRQCSGSIIFMTSFVGLYGNSGQCNYAAAGGGRISFAKSVAKEYGVKGIRANVISTGVIETEFLKELPEDERNEWIQQIPLRKFGTVEDIANTATVLASDMSSYITGQVIQIDGGMNM